MMNVIGATWDGWAEITGGNIPVVHTIGRPEKGAVQGPNRIWIGKVDGGIIVFIRFYVVFEFRSTLDQCFKIIPLGKSISRMKAFFILVHEIKLSLML